jgi:hypothetical protein
VIPSIAPAALDLTVTAIPASGARDLPRRARRSARSPLRGCGQRREEFLEAWFVVDVGGQARERVGENDDWAVGPADQAPPVGFR